MQGPPEISYQGRERSAALDQRIREEVEKLETFHHRIASCRVVIGAPHRRHHQGNLYTIRVHMMLPGGAEVTVDRNPSAKHAHEDPYVVVRDAFMAARRPQRRQASSYRIKPYTAARGMLRTMDLKFDQSVAGHNSVRPCPNERTNVTTFIAVSASGT